MCADASPPRRPEGSANAIALIGVMNDLMSNDLDGPRLLSLAVVLMLLLLLSLE